MAWRGCATLKVLGQIMHASLTATYQPHSALQTRQAFFCACVCPKASWLQLCAAQLCDPGRADMSGMHNKQACVCKGATSVQLRAAQLCDLGRADMSAVRNKQAWILQAFRSAEHQTAAQLKVPAVRARVRASELAC
eukprot:scaffold65698_cov18-Tisochrysis_lutea.AAC.1